MQKNDMQKILMIDNYDSFTYNVVHLIHLVTESKYELIVKKNDEISIEEITEMNPFCIFISPGPCSPKEAGISLNVIEHFYKTKPIMGVCLGHQAICQFFGGVIDKTYPFHGRESMVLHNKDKLFDGIPSPFQVIRYHSLCLKGDCPKDIEIIATSAEDGVVMAVKHARYPVYGVQFHPESILSTFGDVLFKNFFKMIESK